VQRKEQVVLGLVSLSSWVNTTCADVEGDGGKKTQIVFRKEEQKNQGGGAPHGRNKNTDMEENAKKEWVMCRGGETHWHGTDKRWGIL